VTAHTHWATVLTLCKTAGAKQLCTVRSDLSGVKDSELELKKRSRGFLSRSHKWLNCSYEVRAIIGPADLNFELWFNGQRFSKNHSPIKVTWDDEGVALGGGTPPPGVRGRGAIVAETGTASGSGSSPAGSVSGLSDQASHTR
jgi:hypothetical protein